MFSFLFKKKNEVETLIPPVVVDMHSHLLPGIDDGAANIEESLLLIESFMNRGYKHLVTTPHVIEDFYKNTPEIIRAKLTEVRQAVAEKGWDIKIDAAAEYLIDEFFIRRVNNKEEILSFGANQYVLIETAFLNEPVYLKDVIFKLQSSGYWPVLAHPERYSYFCNDFKRVKDIFATGVLFQINLPSLSGYYSRQSQQLAERLIDENMVHFVGSDCHKTKHIDAIDQAKHSRHYKKLLDMSLLNNSL
jgi:protein-tyrosine phosphatase